MRVRIDHERCNGYGVCVSTSPEVFDLDDAGIAFVLPEHIDGVAGHLDEVVAVAIMSCPQGAICVVES